MKNKKVIVAGVSLREACAISENHLLSEALIPLSELENLEENMPTICALSMSSARSVSRLSPSMLSASLVLSKNSLTHAKHENGAKHDVEVIQPFLSLE